MLLAMTSGRGKTRLDTNQQENSLLAGVRIYYSRAPLLCEFLFSNLVTKNCRRWAPDRTTINFVGQLIDSLSSAPSLPAWKKQSLGFRRPHKHAIQCGSCIRR